MTDEDWNRAHGIASEVVRREADPNELAKVASYFRSRLLRETVVKDFWLLLDRLTRAQAFVRSNQTLAHHRSIKEACTKFLQGVSDPQQMAAILGWSVRLSRYYQVSDRGSQGSSNAGNRPRRM